AMCYEPGPPCDEYWKSSAVFVGTVQTITTASPATGSLGKLLRVRLTVAEAFKGVNGTSVELISEDWEEGPHFSVGRQYFVYAFRDNNLGHLRAADCGLTRPLEDAGGDLEYARRAALGATSGEIFGELLHTTPETAMRPLVNRPLAGVRVSLH